VKTRVKGWALSVVMTMLSAGPSFAADDVSVLKDLTAVIALQALPCGQVVSVVRQGDSDYITSWTGTATGCSSTPRGGLLR
jgi:hypothetical protein